MNFQAFKEFLTYKDEEYVYCLNCKSQFIFDFEVLKRDIKNCLNCKNELITYKEKQEIENKQ